MTAMTGSTSRYGTLRPATRRPDRRRRRDAPWGIAAAVVSVGALPLRRDLQAVFGLGDVLARCLSSLLDGQTTREKLPEHRLENVAVLDVHPVLRLRHEPAAGRCPLVDAGADEVGRVRDVALLLECLLAGRAREVGHPRDRRRLRIALGRNGQGRAAEEARDRLALDVAPDHGTACEHRVGLPGAAGVP